MFAIGAGIEARRRQDLGILPDFLMFIGGGMGMWMAAKLFWMDDPPEWFAIFVTVGWLIILGMATNLLQRGVFL